MILLSSKYDFKQLAEADLREQKAYESTRQQTCALVR